MGVQGLCAGCEKTQELLGEQRSGLDSLATLTSGEGESTFFSEGWVMEEGQGSPELPRHLSIVY